MNLNKIQVYHIFWLVTLLSVVIGITKFNNSSGVVDIPVANMYYVITYFNLSLIIALIYFLLGAGYWIVMKIFSKKLVKPMTIFHSSILIGSFVAYWLVVIYQMLFMEFSPMYLKYRIISETLFGLILLIIVIAQPVYIINLLIGLFSKKLTNEK